MWTNKQTTEDEINCHVFQLITQRTMEYFQYHWERGT